MDAEKVCSSCALKGSDLQKCAGCKSVWYCNVKCQKKDWKMHKSMCTAQGNKGKERSVKKERRETSGRACELCGKTGAKLFKCGACQSVRYCGSVCQNTDWKNHIFDCSVVKLYPEDQKAGDPVCCLLSSLPADDLNGADAVFGKRVTEMFMGKEKDMIVKVQLVYSFDKVDGRCTTYNRDLMVYNESKEYFVFVRGSDRNKYFIGDKIIEEGSITRLDKNPMLNKLYFKAHLNSDSSLDIFPNRTYKIQDW